MNVLALVIARGGSKGILGKNLKDLGGIPLVAYKIISARKSKRVSRVILSSDCPEIQAAGILYGAEIPFNRPVELASDTASSDDVAIHAMNWIDCQDGPSYDALLLLEPSTPFATAEVYDQAIQILQERRAKAVIGMTEHKVNRIFIGEMEADDNIRPIINQMSNLNRLDRQSLAPNFTMNGAFYLMDWQFYLATKRRYTDSGNSYGVIMDSYHSVEIDLPIDLEWARFLIERKYVDPTNWKMG
jgi:CMP-N,N'-diacetyllegionaminic acid synthase